MPVVAVGLFLRDEAKAEPHGIAAGEQAGARRRAYRRGRVEVCEAHAFGGHTIDPRRLDAWRAVAAEIVVALVVGENDDDVRWAGLRASQGGDRDEDEEECGESHAG